jgi:hypothetical protein
MQSTDILELAGAILLSLGGAAALLAGLSNWLGKLWAKRILEREQFSRTKELEVMKAQIAEALEHSKSALVLVQAKESAELAHRTHVSKAQFDLEFKIYQELWNRIEALRTSSVKYWHGLKESMGTGPQSSSQIAEAKLGQQKIADLYQSFVEHYLAQSPFISKPVKSWLDENMTVLAAINGVSRMAYDAAVQNNTKEFENIGAAQLQINAIQAEFADVIHERIASVAIIG